MRTTVTLDDDVAERVQDVAHRERHSFKATLNALLRKGLAVGDKPTGHSRRYVVKPHASSFRAGVDPQRLNQLVDELEAERVIRPSSR